jgi:hypothetical protein
VSDAPLEKRLTPTEVEEVLRRAVEIHSRSASATTDDASFSEADVERIGGEIGVAPQAVRTALVHVRRDALMKPTQPPTAMDRFFGPRWVIAARTVPGPRVDVLDAIGALLQDQLFRVRRNLGATVVWSRGEGMLDQLKRAFDFSKHYHLSPADSVVVTTSEAAHPEGWVDVRMEVGLGEFRRSKLRGSIAGFVILFGVGASVAAGLGPASAAFWPLLLGGGGTGSWIVSSERHKVLREAARIRDNVERFLDYLERERVPGVWQPR